MPLAVQICCFHVYVPVGVWDCCSILSVIKDLGRSVTSRMWGEKKCITINRINVVFCLPVAYLSALKTTFQKKVVLITSDFTRIVKCPTAQEN